MLEVISYKQEEKKNIRKTPGKKLISAIAYLEGIDLSLQELPKNVTATEGCVESVPFENKINTVCTVGLCQVYLAKYL